MKSKILITGAAGFIGAALSKKLLDKGYFIIGIDNINDYYSPQLKNDRINLIEKNAKYNSSSWIFEKVSIDNKKNLNLIFEKYKPSIVINLAAQAGVRYSLVNPNAYIQSNITGFLNILECCKEYNIEKLIYASSSSVYGSNKKLPFSENDVVSHPISLYAATKRSNELMAHTYSSLYGIHSIGLRFFTVYGPWGRPDMAPMKFAKNILEGKPIEIFNNGNMLRDFTYIDDVVNLVIQFIKYDIRKDNGFNSLKPDPSSSFAPHRIFNLGSSSPIKLMDFIGYLEKYLEVTSIKKYLPLQKGDAISTHADTSRLITAVGKYKMTKFSIGIKKFVEWFKEYY